MEENSASPIAPIVASGMTVTAALQRASEMHARMVVEATEKLFRLHAIAALQSLHARGDGETPLGELAALEVGWHRDTVEVTGISTVPDRIAIRFLTGETSPRRRYAMDFVHGNVAPDSIERIVSKAYKCPVDGEPFEGPGRCDLHDRELDPSDG